MSRQRREGTNTEIEKIGNLNIDEYFSGVNEQNCKPALEYLINLQIQASPHIDLFLKLLLVLR